MDFEREGRSLVKSLASDNASGIHSEFLKVLSSINEGHVLSYGQDVVTERAIAMMREICGTPRADVFFVFNGTAANVVCLGGLTDRHEAVVCSEVSHLNVDECGAPEKVMGLKLIPVSHVDGKISIADLEKVVIRGGDQHYAQPRVVSLTQPTELGTCYSIAEIKEIVAWCESRGLKVHLDGARLANSCYTLGVSFQQLIGETGVHAVSFGGTKNGMSGAEAVIFPKGGLDQRGKFLRKFSMQLASKQRFMSVQFVRYFEGELWKSIAAHVCGLAKHLEAGVKGIPGIEVTRPVQSNAVFAKIPKWSLAQLRKDVFFYVWDEEVYEVRWMISFDWTKQDVDRFVAHVKAVCTAGPASS